MGAPNMPSLTTLSSWWRSTAEPPARWSSIRGPVGATRFVLRQLGWRMEGDSTPLVFRTRGNISMNIMEHGPKMLKNKVKQDWPDILAEQVAVQHVG